MKEEEVKRRAKHTMSLKGALQPKQETLDEVAKQNALSELEKYEPTKERFKLSCKNSFLRGAEWQNKKMFSEEEVLKILEIRLNGFGISTTSFKNKKWFEQFKKN